MRQYCTALALVTLLREREMFGRILACEICSLGAREGPASRRGSRLHGRVRHEARAPFEERYSSPDDGGSGARVRGAARIPNACAVSA